MGISTGDRVKKATRGKTTPGAAAAGKLGRVGIGRRLECRRRLRSPPRGRSPADAAATAAAAAARKSAKRRKKCEKSSGFGCPRGTFALRHALLLVRDRIVYQGFFTLRCLFIG